MAKPVTFGGKKAPKKSGATSFDFGVNTLSKTAKRAYRKQLKKAGHSGGGS